MARKSVDSVAPAEVKPSAIKAGTTTEVSVLAECAALKAIVDKAYAEGVLMDDAEKYAARFLSAQMLIAEELQRVDLEARMRKNGVKAAKASIWIAAATKDEKKPSDKFLDSIVDSDVAARAEQEAYDRVDSYKESLSLYLGVFKDGHIYMRGIAKGRYE